MKKVFYNTYFADPWVKVAQKLKQEHGYEPVYWTGDFESDSIVPLAFPDVIYQSNLDACMGIFPREITERFAGTCINIDFLKANASFELQALKMLDRMDPDRYSFNFMERQRHVRNYYKYWTACIELLKPDLVISGNVPHQVSDYVLYLLCKFYGIRQVIFIWTSFLGRSMAVTDLASIGRVFDEPGVEMKAEWLKSNLPGEIHQEYENIKLAYDTAEPDYMRKQKIEHRASSGLLPLTKKFFLDIYQLKNLYFGRDGYFMKGIPIYYKQQSKSVEKSRTTILKYSILKLKTNAYKNYLKKYYNSLVSNPDLTVPYIVFYLHYQPELTSSPAGDIFVDQRLCIDVLAKHIPAGYYIYVKEHPSQFYAHNEGHTSRMPDFYDDLITYPQVRLLPAHFDPFLLIKNSRAVSTINGTAGWEAMVLGKPVIIFGLAWYERYQGVLKIVDEKSASRIAPFIENFTYDEKSLLSYLYMFSKKSVKAYTLRGWKEKMNQAEAECVSNLANHILQMATA